MILGPVSYLDCIVFCVFLAPQLILHVGLLETIRTVLRCIPFVVVEAPLLCIHERYFISPKFQSPFVRQASPFEDFVIRCVRYAFANVPAKVGRVFFSKDVALPFLRWRLLRHGYIKSPIQWTEYRGWDFRGVWAISDPAKKADIVIYYVHGGGFSMGSTYFYLEFLLSWLSLLKEAGYRNPAIFGLEYTLVPDASFPTQLEEVVHGYEHALAMAGDPSIVCVSGDSAGGTLILSLLLCLAHPESVKTDQPLVGVARNLERPGMAVLISPWPSLSSRLYVNTVSDYLDVYMLHVYGAQYAGKTGLVADPLVSPGDCKNVRWWEEASPLHGIFVTYGQEEVFAPEIEELVKCLGRAGSLVKSDAEPGGIHAWPVASLFLSDTREQRLKGLRSIVTKIRERLPVASKEM